MNDYIIGLFISLQYSKVNFNSIPIQDLLKK